MTAASDVQMELLCHTLRRLVKAPVSALLVHKVSIFHSQTNPNIDHILACSMGSKFRPADSQHYIRLREIVFDGF